MKNKKRVVRAIKYVFILLVILANYYILYNLLNAVELIVGFITISVGILTIIWILLAKYSLSPKSTLRLFTNNFLACTIGVMGFSLTRLIGKLVYVKWLILVEFFFIFATFFFFLVAAYYIYTIGKEFGFQSESKQIVGILKLKKKKKK